MILNQLITILYSILSSKFFIIFLILLLVKKLL